MTGAFCSNQTFMGCPGKLKEALRFICLFVCLFVFDIDDLYGDCKIKLKLLPISNASLDTTALNILFCLLPV